MAAYSGARGAGRLRHRVQFQQRAAGTDDLNEATGAWADLGDPVPADVTPTRGYQRLQAGAVQQVMDATAVLRHRPGRSAADILSLGLRLVFNGLPYDITAAVPMAGDPVWIELSLVQGVRDGR